MHEDLLCRFVEDRGELMGYLRVLVPGDLVDDAFQETFLVVMRRVADFERERDFPAWVRGIARNVALQVRDRHRRASVALPDDVVDLIDQAHAQPDHDREDLVHLRTCLGRLGTAQREMLRQRYHAGHSLHRLAEAAGRTPGAVQVALSRLRTTLQECIERARQVRA
ncbi:MAG: sigma-70 family RNA polymerase sigma factor [Planctomycetota bacterium]